MKPIKIDQDERIYKWNVFVVVVGIVLVQLIVGWITLQALHFFGVDTGMYNAHIAGLVVIAFYILFQEGAINRRVNKLRRNGKISHSFYTLRHRMNKPRLPLPQQLQSYGRLPRNWPLCVTYRKYDKNGKSAKWLWTIETDSELHEAQKFMANNTQDRASVNDGTYCKILSIKWGH